MEIKEFDILSFDAKASLISRYGKYLDQKTTKDGSRIMVYDLFGFYAEVSYRNDRRVQYIRVVENIFQETHTNMDSLVLLHLN